MKIITFIKKQGTKKIILWACLVAIVMGIAVMMLLKSVEDRVLADMKLGYFEVIIRWNAPKEVAETPPEKSVAVRTMVIEPRSVPAGVMVPGRVEALVEAVLAAEKPGRIIELTADKGDAVKEGQVLLRLDDRTWKAALEQAEVENKQLAKDLSRWREMEKQGAVSTKEYDDIKLRKEASDIAVEQAKIALSQCVVKSPVNGHVADRMVEEGEYANEGQAVFVVVDTARVKVKFDIPESNISAVEQGGRISFIISALGGRICTGEVAFVSPLAGRENNAFAAELLADNEDGALKPGMVITLDLPLGMTDNAIVVPLAAVIPKKGEHVVFVVEDGRAVRRVVKMDRIVDDRVILSGGVAAGEALVIEGHRSLSDGMLLQIMD
ncbi:MAG: efflux RND transporter periplasmic adaptor subunit [Kiritimatiellia bacterium]